MASKRQRVSEDAVQKVEVTFERRLNEYSVMDDVCPVMETSIVMDSKRRPTFYNIVMRAGTDNALTLAPDGPPITELNKPLVAGVYKFYVRGWRPEESEIRNTLRRTADERFLAEIKVKIEIEQAKLAHMIAARDRIVRMLERRAAQSSSSSQDSSCETQTNST